MRDPREPIMKTVYFKPPRREKAAAVELLEIAVDEAEMEALEIEDNQIETEPAVEVEAADYIRYRVLKKTETEEASIFVRGVFRMFIAPSLKPLGREEFMKYTTPEQFHARLCDNYTYVAINKGKIVGLINARNVNHISLLYVTLHMQKQGVARQLLDFVVKRARKKGCSEISVNSSLYAIAAYEHLGFVRMGERSVENGIVFVRMVKQIEA
ncbi:MAG: GNAT family N-acetyltransferase [Bacillota bacterium]